MRAPAAAAAAAISLSSPPRTFVFPFTPPFPSTIVCPQCIPDGVLPDPDVLELHSGGALPERGGKADLGGGEVEEGGEVGAEEGGEVGRGGEEWEGKHLGGGGEERRGEERRGEQF